jgi:hypothetical protein
LESVCEVSALTLGLAYQLRLPTDSQLALESVYVSLSAWVYALVSGLP